MNKPKTKKLFNKKLKTKKRNKRSIKTFDYTQKAGTLTTNNVYEDSKFFRVPLHKTFSLNRLLLQTD